MARPFIAVHKSNGKDYAAVCTPARVNGKKVNNPIYLGRVVDLEKGIFRSKARGVFTYTLEHGFSYPEKNPELAVSAAIARGSLSLGHVYCTNALLDRTGLKKLFLETDESSPDTLFALIMHRLLDCYADSHANAFLEQTYACILYPKADLSPQAISRYLAKLGIEAIRRDFLRRYIAMMYPQENPVGILIDSTGLPNEMQMTMNAVINHGNGPIKETRLIYVVDKESFSPIYYRAIPGDVVDIATLQGTIRELKALNVNIRCSVLDAWYNSESDLEDLFSLEIDFMTRLISNRGLYKELLAKNCDAVMHPSNRLVYNQRLIYMTMNKVKLPNNRDAFAYIGVDFAKKCEKVTNISLTENQDKPMTDEEFDEKTKTAGMFVMISSLEMDKADVLPFCYSRQTIEEIFDVGKNYARLLPLGSHSRETFNGHLLLSFMTTIVYLKLQRIFHKKKFNPIDFITELRGVTCGVYEDHLHVYEPTAKQKEILKILKMEIPTILPLQI
jgi:hypothetical protein